MWKKKIMLQKIKQNKEIFYSIVLIVIPVTILFSFTIFLKIRSLPPIIAEEIEITNDNRNVFADVVIEAKAAIVKDLNTGEIIYEKNKDLPLALASITKVLTALTFEINTNKEIISISDEDLKELGDSLLFSGERFYKKDIVGFTLMTSSNDASAALAANAFGGIYTGKNIFIEEMNRVAKLIGMKNSFFYNETGLDNSATSAGAHGSVNDVATLFEYTMKNYPEILESTGKSSAVFRSINGYTHQATNTNEIIDRLPNAIASKTGFTDIAGGNLAVVIDPALNRPVVIVVLGSTSAGRFTDVEKLAKKTEEYFKLFN
jgi:D-alanyl-D-alanine carboxypeptidase